jgi:hypothetical protein
LGENKLEWLNIIAGPAAPRRTSPEDGAGPEATGCTVLRQDDETALSADLPLGAVTGTPSRAAEGARHLANRPRPLNHRLVERQQKVLRGARRADRGWTPRRPRQAHRAVRDVGRPQDRHDGAGTQS